MKKKKNKNKKTNIHVALYAVFSASLQFAWSVLTMTAIFPLASYVSRSVVALCSGLYWRSVTSSKIRGGGGGGGGGSGRSVLLL